MLKLPWLDGGGYAGLFSSFSLSLSSLMGFAFSIALLLNYLFMFL